MHLKVRLHVQLLPLAGYGETRMEGRLDKRCCLCVRQNKPGARVGVGVWVGWVENVCVLGDHPLCWEGHHH